MVLSTQWRSVGENIVLAGAVLASLGLIAHKTRALVTRVWHTARAELRDAISADTREQFDRVHARLDEGTERLEVIERELSFDHGHSLKDAVFQIKQRMGLTDDDAIRPPDLPGEIPGGQVPQPAQGASPRRAPGGTDLPDGGGDGSHRRP